MTYSMASLQIKFFILHFHIMTLTETLNLIQRNVITYFYSVYLIFGVTGCCLNILLLCRRQFRTVSCCICKYIL